MPFLWIFRRSVIPKNIANPVLSFSSDSVSASRLAKIGSLTRRKTVPPYRALGACRRGYGAGACRAWPLPSRGGASETHSHYPCRTVRGYQTDGWPWKARRIRPLYPRSIRTQRRRRNG